MISRLLVPLFNQAHNPLYIAATRRLRWLQTPERARALTAQLLLIPASVLVLLFVGAVAAYALLEGAPYYGRFNLGGSYMYFASTLLQWALLGTVGLNLLLDGLCLNASINGYTADIRAGRWELLRLTTLSPLALVVAKYAAALARVHQAMVLVMATRLGAAIIFFVVVVILPLIQSWARSYFFNQWRGMLVLALTLTVVGVAFVAEPWWRARFMTTVGGYITARWRHRTLVNVVSLVFEFAFLGLHLLGIAAWLLLITLPARLNGWRYGEDYDLYVLFVCGVTVVAIYLFYSRMANWLLRCTARDLYRADAGN